MFALAVVPIVLCSVSGKPCVSVLIPAGCSGGTLPCLEEKTQLGKLRTGQK